MNDRLTKICRGQLEMVITWSIEAVFHKDCIKEVCFPLEGLDEDAARAEYKHQAYLLLSKLHNAPTKGRKK